MKIVRRTCGTTSSRFQRSTRSFVPWHLQLEFLVLWCHTKMESDGSSEAPPASEPPMMRRIVRSIALSWNPLFEARFGARLPKLEKPQRNLPYLREAEGARIH